MSNDLQEYAERWVAANNEIARLDTEARKINYEQSKATEKRKACADELLKRVGNNVRTKVFKVDNQVVIVEHEHGVRMERIETLT